jgi:hypothetical protein
MLEHGNVQWEQAVKGGQGGCRGASRFILMEIMLK